jgi:hypothetical protein
MTGGTRDLGKGLNQVKVDDDSKFQGWDAHWKIEGYDVYVGSAWEGTHTSRWAVIKKNGQPIERVGNISEARQWIRHQVAVSGS